LNIIFASAVFLLMAHRFNRRILFVIYLLFLCSTPLRNSIGNGQQSLLCLFLYMSAVNLADRGHRSLASTVAGLGSFKFSFGVPLLPAFMFDRWKYVALYGIPTVIGILFWVIYFHRGLIETIFLPLSVSQGAIGAADLLSILKMQGFSQSIWLGVPLLILCAVMVIERVWYPIADTLDAVAFYAILSLLLIYHSSYDQVFLLPCALIVLGSESFAVRLVTWAIVGYFWYGLKVITLLIGWDSWILVYESIFLWINQVCLWVLLGTLIAGLREKNRTSIGDTSIKAAWAGQVKSY
jgi:hypothetical protein